jgi:hypothetical protein
MKNSELRAKNKNCDKIEKLRRNRGTPLKSRGPMPKLSNEANELFLGPKRDTVVYGLSMTGKTALVEARISQSSRHSDVIAITDSVEPGVDVSKPDWMVLTRVKRPTKISIKPTRDLLLAGKPNNFCKTKTDALFSAKKRWTDIVLDDWERHLPYRVGGQSVFNYLAGLLTATAGRRTALILIRHDKLGGAGRRRGRTEGRQG